MIIGALLPDIIDKPLLLLSFGTGRGFAHTLLLAFIIYGISFVISKRNHIIAFSVFLGIIFHLILDLPEVPLFYPFIFYDYIFEEDPLDFWLYQLFHNPLVIATEIIGLGVIIFIVINHKLFRLKSIIKYLLTEQNVN